ALLSPTSDKTVINFQKNGSNFYETLRQVYQGQTTVLQTLYTCYNGAAADCSSIGITPPISRITTTTQLDNGQQSKTDTFLNGNSLPTQVDEYDFGNGGSGGLLRRTLTSYTYAGMDRVASVQVLDGGGAQKAYTSYGYDQTAVSGTSGVPQHVGVG